MRSGILWKFANIAAYAVMFALYSMALLAALEVYGVLAPDGAGDYPNVELFLMVLVFSVIFIIYFFVVVIKVFGLDFFWLNILAAVLCVPIVIFFILVAIGTAVEVIQGCYFYLVSFSCSSGYIFWAGREQLGFTKKSLKVAGWVK